MKKMSSRRNFLQEFQFSEASRNRKKVDVDGFRLIKTANDATRQREEENNPEKFESKYDLRKSLAWDSAFFTSPGVLDPEELFEALNIHDGDHGLKEASALPSESMVAIRAGECIPRRSLAWDTAFFTSAGVLNPEELSMVNRGYNKSEAHTLPGIEEEFLKSAESNSEMDSDYSLASLEIDLFDDMKASMQKSSKLESQKGIPNPHSSKRLDTATSMRIKPLLDSRRPKISQHGVVKPAKEVINPPQAKHATRSGEPGSSSSVKMSEGYSHASPLSSTANKRASLKVTKVASVIGQNMSKKPCFGDSGRGSFIPSSTSSPEPASSRFQVACRDHSASPCGQISSIDKSPISLRRKNDLAASYSKARTPLRSLTRHRSRQTDSSQPTDLLSTPKSSSKSLSTSIDCWSSETSASANHTFNKFTKSLNSPFSKGAVNYSSDQPFVGRGSKKTRLPCQDVGTFSNGSCPPSPTVSREEKPSGLRLPSPKIGFFDVENSRALTPNGGLKFHSGMQNTSKTRSVTSHLSGTPNRAKYGKIQLSRTSTRMGSVKEKTLGSLKAGDQSFRGIKPIATSFKAQTDLSCELSDGYGSKTDGLGSYLKGKTQSENKERATQLVKRSSPDQNKDTSALDDKENLFIEKQVDILTRQIEAIDFNGSLVMEF